MQISIIGMPNLAIGAAYITLRMQEYIYIYCTHTQEHSACPDSGLRQYLLLLVECYVKSWSEGSCQHSKL